MIPPSKAAALCGHQVNANPGIVRAYGETTKTKMPKNEQGSYDYCFDCLGDMAIRCGWCGKAIFIGDMVTLYAARDPDFKIPDVAAIYELKNKSLVGCLRASCADSGADYCGHWVPADVQVEGRWVGGVSRFESAIEMALRSRRPVIANDIGADAQKAPHAPVKVPERLPLNRT